MYKIVYKDDNHHVSLLNADTYEECILFIKNNNFNIDDLIIETNIRLNIELSNFFKLIENKNNVNKLDLFVKDRSISTKDLALNCSYISGGAYIGGIAFGKLVEVFFNVYQYDESYVLIVDGKEIIPPISKEHIRNFFETGNLYEGIIFKD